MTAQSKRNLLNRILSTQGHIGAIAKMIDADEPSTDVLHQMRAVCGAMRAINRKLWQTYLLDADCGLRAPNRRKRERTWEQLQEMIAKENYKAIRKR